MLERNYHGAMEKSSWELPDLISTSYMAEAEISSIFSLYVAYLGGIDNTVKQYF